VVERNDRVGLVGPNGAGKTTIVRILLGDEEPTTGELAWGHNVRIAYFSQHATDDLDVGRTVLETLTDRAEAFTETEARNYLGRFLFTRDDVYKKVAMLSGGEKNKLALALMLLEPCNLLILDEPTNHLDIESGETLTEMLTRYDGTLLLVSHDRYLLNAVTTKTLALTGAGGAVFVEGNYAVWRESEEEARTPAPAPKVKDLPLAAPSAAVAPFRPHPTLSAHELSKARIKARDALEKAEHLVQAREAELADVEAALAAGDPTADLVALAAEYTRLRAAVDAAVGDWERAAAESESLL
jgi:ATP-binding cassette, subfamily F, member 3